MAVQKSNRPHGPAQAPRGGYALLAYILDGLSDQLILDALQRYRRTGRRGYPLRAMWRLYLSKFILKIRYNNQLLERLRGSRRFREVCGFGDDVPSETALSRFVSRLANHQDLIEQCFVDVTDELRDLAPAVRQRPGRQPQPLPPVGMVLAVDSTVFPTYSNPNRKTISDPDARWGVKHSSKAKNGNTDWMFGYKMHLVSDATHGIPLAFTLTPANVNDHTEMRPAVRKTMDAYPWMQPGCLLADRGYDSVANHEFLVKQGIIPVILIRKPTAKDGLYDGIYTESGLPTCVGREPMEYVRTDPATGAHLFRCRVGGCPLKTAGTKATTHCDTEMWERPEANPRVLGPLPRFTKEWWRLYRQRMSIERIFRSLKHSRGLEGHCMRGMRKLALHATLSVLTFQATVLARLKAGDAGRMREMAVVVA